MSRELTDDEVFGAAHELTDDEVFGRRASAKPTPAKPSPMAGRPTKPLAGADEPGIGGMLKQLSDQIYRTYAGGGADLADAASGIINRPVNAVLDAVRAPPSMRLPVDGLAPHVPQPVGAVSQVSRALVPFIAGGAGLETAVVRAAPKLAARAPIRTNIVAGAPIDAAMAHSQDQNLSNLIQDATGVPLPTARVAGENEGIAALKDMTEGGTIGAAVGLALKFFTRGPSAPAGSSEAIDEELVVQQAVADPIVRAQLEASGITPESTPRYGEFVARAEEIKAAKAAALSDPHRNAEPGAFRRPARPEGAPPPSAAAIAADRSGQTVDYRNGLRAAQEELEARTRLPPSDPDYIDPAALPSAGTEQTVRGAPMRVTPDGQAFTPSAGALVGQDLRKPSNLPVPVDPPVRPMSDAEIAAARAEPRVNPIPERDTMTAPEGRAPQMRDDVQGQRQAGEAFALADRQATRVADGVRDTQVAGLPKGPEPQRVMLDDGFPVRVVEEGKGGAVRVERYDPRTGLREDGAEPYWTTRGGLHQTDYTPEPRRAQDFGARDNPARMSPEEPRMADSPVVREPTQTYRTTPVDEGGHPDGGRPPLPDQPDGPPPWPSEPRAERAQRAETEDELHARYRDARADQQEQAAADRARAAYRDRDVKTSPSVAEPDADGRFGVDEFGFVRSAADGPVTYGTQKQAANWILNVGHKRSPDQIFEIANGPKRGFTVREAGRSQPGRQPPGDASQPENFRDQAAQSPDQLARYSTIDPAAPQSVPADGAAASGPQYRSAYERGGENPEAPTASPTRTDGGGGASVGVAAPGSENRFAIERGGRNPGAPGSSPARTDGGGENPVGASEIVPREREIGNGRPAQGTSNGPASLRGQAEDPGRPTEPNKLPGAETRNTEQADAERPPSAFSEKVNAAAPKETAALDDALNKLKSVLGPYEEGGAGSTKLYANPLDPEAIKELLLDPAVKAARAAAKAAAPALKEAADKVKPAATSASRAYNALWSSNGQAMRVIGSRYSGKAREVIDSIADSVATAPGTGKQIVQTFERAVQERTMGMANRLKNVMGEKVDEGLDAKVADILSGRKRALSGSKEAVTARRVRTLLDEQYDYLTAAGVEVGYVKSNYFPRVVDADAVSADTPGFLKAAAKVYRDMGLDAQGADEAAGEWLARLNGVTDGHFAPGLPASRATKGRTLPASADKILEQFYIKDSRANLATYFRQTSRLAEATRRWGKNGEKLQEMFNDLAREGVAKEDINLLRHHFDSSTGNLYSTKAASPLNGLVSGIQMVGILSLLPRAVISSVAEGLSIGVRSHDVARGALGFIDSLRELTSLRQEDDVRALAEMTGIIGDAMTDMIIASKHFGGDSASPTLAAFFKAQGLHQLTEAQRVAAARIGQGFISRLLEDVVTANGRAKSASFLLRELGMDDAQAKALHSWLAKNDGVVPMDRIMGLEPEARSYRTALQRFVDECVQNPSAADRPMLANHGYGRLAYSISSFMFSATKNVLARTARTTTEALSEGYTLEDRARLVAPAFALAVLTAGQSQISELRDMVLNPKAREERTPTQQLLVNMDRSGAFGTYSPFLNMLMSARYERDASSLITGPYVGYESEAIINIIKAFGNEDMGNSPRTNNAEWTGARAGYAAIAAPLIAAALSRASSAVPGGGFLSTLGRIGIGATMQAAVAPGTSRAVADATVGERTVKPRTRKKAETADEGRDADFDLSLDFDEPAEGDRGAPTQR